MTLADHARTLIAYNAWANTTLLDAAEHLSDEELGAEARSGYGSIIAKLRHIVSAQATWLARWTSESLPSYHLLTREGMRAAYEDSHRRLESFATTLTDADWDSIIEYRDSSGAEQSAPLGRLITHVVNHGTLHRGEAGMLLAAHNRSPGDLDFVYWARDHRVG